MQTIFDLITEDFDLIKYFFKQTWLNHLDFSKQWNI